MDAQKHEGQQRQVAMKAGSEKAWPPGYLPAKGPGDAEDHYARQQYQRDGACAASRVPEDLVAHAAGFTRAGHRPAV